MKQPTNNIAQEIGIIIPTMNRSNYLERLLGYYARAHFPGPIYIGDSSNEVHLNKTKEALQKYQDILRITYKEYPNLNEPQTTVQLISQVTMPYVAFVSDDDFLVPTGLAKCATFLEESREYSVCIGQAALLSLQSNGGHPEWASSTYGAYRDVLNETASDRFLNFMDNSFVNAFAVHRTEEMKEAYKGVDILRDKSFTELLPTCFSVLQGKIKKLDCFYLARQHHEGRYLLPDAYDWLTNENWLPSYQQFANRLSSMLAQKDNLPSEKAHEIVKKGFWKYLANVFPQKWIGKYRSDSGGLKSRFKQMAKKIPPLAQLRGGFYSYTPNGRMSLQGLLRKSSPYYTDFLPIYQAVQDAKPQNIPKLTEREKPFEVTKK